MITDQYSNTLYLSDLLEKDFQVFHIEFSRALAKNDIYVKILHGTKAVWCRDYMPIQVKGDKFVQFKYQPSYLKGLEHTISDTTAICKRLKIDVAESDIKIDGGNIIKSDDAVILTDRIFKENPTKNKEEILKEIKTVLEVEKVIIIPANPWEDFGHADGMVRFFDNKTVLVNDYSKSRESRSFQEKLYGILGKHGLNILQIPCYPDYSRTKERNQLAYGIYINYLQIGNKVFLPIFGNDEQDEEAFLIFERLFGKNVIPIYSKPIAAEGGVLNCISWNIYSKTAIPSKLPKGSVDLGDMWKFVFDQVPFRLFHDEYEDIESSFKKVWNFKLGQRLGDGDCKNEIYAMLKEMDRQPFIPQFVVDGVVDALLNYQESIGQYGDDYSIN